MKEIIDDENRKNLGRGAEEEMPSQEQDRQVAEPQPIPDSAALLPASWLGFQMAHHDNTPLSPEVTWGCLNPQMTKHTNGIYLLNFGQPDLSLRRQDSFLRALF